MILDIHSRDLPLSSSLDKQALAARLSGFTGADIACLVREAAYAALRRTFDLDAVLCGTQPLSADSLRRMRVTARDFKHALEAIRQRQKSVGGKPGTVKRPRTTRHAE